MRMRRENGMVPRLKPYRRRYGAPPKRYGLYHKTQGVPDSAELQPNLLVLLSTCFPGFEEEYESCNNHQACSVGAPGCQRSQARRAALTVVSLPLWPLCPVTLGCIPGVCCLSTRSTLPKFRYCSSCGWQACPNCNVEHPTGTVLHIAAHCNMGADVICRLLDLGGRELLDRPDSTGKTARQLASDQSHTAVVSEIDRWSSQQTAWEQASNRNSSFIQAAQANDHDTLKRLMTQHVDIFAQDADGCTALHRAAEAGHTDAAAFLVQKGGLRLAAMTDKRGKTARDFAVFHQMVLQMEAKQAQTETELRDFKAKHSGLSIKLEAQEAENDALKSEVAALTQENERLKARITELEG